MLIAARCSSVRAPGPSSTSARRLREALDRSVDRGEIPGAVAVLAQGNATHVVVVGSEAIGGDPMQRTTLFRIASMTKPIVAAAAMILVERGILDLDGPVTRLLPELGQRTVLRDPCGHLDDVTPAVREITLRDLLVLCLGLGLAGASLDRSSPIQRAMLELEIGGASKPPPDEWMRRLGSLPLMYQPGQKWLYNTGYDVLGVMIARATGGSLESYLRESLFEPLGMANTGFRLPLEQLSDFATSYGVVNPAIGALDLYDLRSPEKRWVAPAFPSGAGGLVTTADDFLAFARMMLAKGRVGTRTLISGPFIEMMVRDHLTASQKTGAGLYGRFFRSYGWGFGVSVVTACGDPRGPNGTYGWDGSLGTTWYTSPRDNVIAILMTQRAWDSFTPPGFVVDFWQEVNRALGR